MLENHRVEGLTFKGRNGYAKAARCCLWGPDSSGQMRVELYSSREGHAAPLAIDGSAEDVLVFARKLVQFAESVQAELQP